MHVHSYNNFITFILHLYLSTSIFLSNILARIYRHKIGKLHVDICMYYYINISFPERVIVENIIQRNVIINRLSIRECNIYFITPNPLKFGLNVCLSS